jgi:hypothetical protein
VSCVLSFFSLAQQQQQPLLIFSADFPGNICVNRQKINRPTSRASRAAEEKHKSGVEAKIQNKGIQNLV